MPYFIPLGAGFAPLTDGDCPDVCTRCLTYRPLCHLVDGVCSHCQPSPVPQHPGTHSVRASLAGAFGSLEAADRWLAETRPRMAALTSPTSREIALYHLTGQERCAPEHLPVVLAAPAYVPPPPPIARGAHVGEVGKRAVLDVLCTAVVDLGLHPEYGQRFLAKMTDEATGGLLVWFTGENLGLDEGKKYRIRATVKEHTSYNGMRQTVVQRVKEVPNGSD